jgi:hypothetical protein
LSNYVLKEGIGKLAMKCQNLTVSKYFIQVIAYNIVCKTWKARVIPFVAMAGLT